MNEQDIMQPQQHRDEFAWQGPGWYGPISRGTWDEDEDGNRIEITAWERVVTDAGQSDYSQASRGAYGQVGNPDWFDSIPEWATRQ